MYPRNRSAGLEQRLANNLVKLLALLTRFFLGRRNLSLVQKQVHTCIEYGGGSTEMRMFVLRAHNHTQTVHERLGL